MSDEKIALFKVKIKIKKDEYGTWASIDWTPESGEYEDVDNFVLPLEYALNIPEAGSFLMPPYTRDWGVNLDLPEQPEFHEEDNEMVNAISNTVRQVLESMGTFEEDFQEWGVILY